MSWHVNSPHSYLQRRRDRAVIEEAMGVSIHDLTRLIENTTPVNTSGHHDKYIRAENCGVVVDIAVSLWVSGCIDDAGDVLRQQYGIMLFGAGRQKHDDIRWSGTVLAQIFPHSIPFIPVHSGVKSMYATVTYSPPSKEWAIIMKMGERETDIHLRGDLETYKHDMSLIKLFLL